MRLLIKDYYICDYHDEKSSNEKFKLHNHDFYEIFIFREGNANYIVEGASYELKSGDVLVLRPDEMHRIYHKGDGCYKRTIVDIKPSFFSKIGIEDYLEVFNSRKSGEKNKIESEIFNNSGIAECLERIKKYSEGYKKLYTPNVKFCFCEFLYLVNEARFSLKSADETNKTSHVIAYINENYKEDLRLEKLAERFFISKEYLCRTFKNTTGYTVDNYIKRKRIMEAEKLYVKGEKLSVACKKAGFRDYSTFYKAYLKIYGVNPKTGLKK